MPHAPLTYISRLSLRVKLALMGAVLLLGLGLLVYSGVHGLQLIRQKEQITAAIEHESSHLQIFLRALAEFALTEGTIPPYQMALSAIEDFERDLSELLIRIKARDVSRILREETLPQWRQLKVEALAYLNQPDTSIYNIDSLIDYGRLTSMTNAILAAMDRAIAIERQYAAQVIGRTFLAMGAAALLTFALTSALFFLVYRSIARPIVEIAAAAARFAEGDLSYERSWTRRDEIGILGRAFADMTAALRTILGDASGVTTKLASGSSTLRQTSQRVQETVSRQKSAMADTAETVGAMAASSAEVARGTQDLLLSATTAAAEVAKIDNAATSIAQDAEANSAVAQEAGQAMRKMMASVREVAQSTQVLRDSAQETSASLTFVEEGIAGVQSDIDRTVELIEKAAAEASGKGLPAVKDAAGGMEQIRTNVQNLVKVINRLGQRSQEIGRVISVIDEIADQTQLLSLNAAILAAQAQEHGAPFGVVAAEIKNLAQRTSDSTREVTELIGSVQNETEASIVMVHREIEAVEKGAELVRGVSRAFESIHHSTGAASEMSKAIRLTTQQQGQQVKAVTGAIKKMAQHIDTIATWTREQSDESQRILAAMEKTGHLSRHIRQATVEQSQSTGQITLVATQTSRQAQQIARDIALQHEREERIAASLASLRQASDEFTRSSADLDHFIRNLNRDTDLLRGTMKSFRL